MLGRPSKAFEAVGRYSEETEFNTADLDRWFDEIEEQLDQHFCVRHLPLLLTQGNLPREGGSGKYYWLTFNNAVIENTGTAKNASS